MTVLYLNLAAVSLLSLFSRYFSKPSIDNFREVKSNKSLIFAAGIILIAVSGLRSNIGDTYVYMENFQKENLTWGKILEEKDIGFGVLQMILQSMTHDPQVLIFTAALITNLLIVKVLYQYSRVIEISLFVYISSGMFLVSMNGLRQFLAASIIFAATTFLIRRKWLLYFLTILLASTIHQSAFILLPIYFLVNRKAWTKETFILLMLAALAVIGYGQFSSLLFSAIEDTQYAGYETFSEGGASYLRVIVNAAPVILAYFGRDKLRRVFPNCDIIVNMSILGLVFMIISTQNWIFARFSIYFGLYNLILISWIVKVFRPKDEKLIYYAIVICYSVYFYYEHVITLNMIYKSNFFSL
ncbi:EpsG family protein [Metabacillus sp. KIGAM252]|uniref:EpsG family protein n=1 Tax=Metabacillus flavus TaxID=2823519 RepID=A0ABS5LGF4_9BACI|nr:EpsG family protein [Metabacillus flavus]MBS2969659.1 EpsG family protein [Metabacillus flavus]